MNKKLNYVLFLIGATIVNIFIMGFLYFIPYITIGLIFALTLKEQMQSELIQNVLAILFMIVLPVFAIGGGYFIYSKLYKLFRSKVNMEKYFEPIFNKKK